MIKVRPFQRKDLELDLLPFYKREYLDNWRENLGEKGTYTFTGIYNDEIVGFGGIQLYWEGVGEGWLLLTANAGKFLKSYSFQKDLLILVRTSLGKLIKNFNLWRVQASVRCDNSMAINFAEHLGFTRNALLEKYCPDKKDAYLYSLLKEV